MERKAELPISKGSLLYPPSFQEWLLAVISLPLTLQRLVGELYQLNRNLKDVVEVGRDFNEGFYDVFNGKVCYK